MKFGNWISMFLPMLAALVMLSGCEDTEARTQGGSNAKDINELKGKISALESKNEELNGKLTSVQNDLKASMMAKIDDVAKKQSDEISNLLKQLSQQAEDTRKLAQTITEASRADYDKELDIAKKTWAGDLQKLREDDQKTFEDLKKFMDNQLRELYPYAYQPRRLDPNSPPPPEQK